MIPIRKIFRENKQKSKLIVHKNKCYVNLFPYQFETIYNDMHISFHTNLTSDHLDYHEKILEELE